MFGAALEVRASILKGSGGGLPELVGTQEEVLKRIVGLSETMHWERCACRAVREAAKSIPLNWIFPKEIIDLNNGFAYMEEWYRSPQTKFKFLEGIGYKDYQQEPDIIAIAWSLGSDSPTDESKLMWAPPVAATKLAVGFYGQINGETLLCDSIEIYFGESLAEIDTRDAAMLKEDLDNAMRKWIMDDEGHVLGGRIKDPELLLRAEEDIRESAYQTGLTRRRELVRILAAMLSFSHQKLVKYSYAKPDRASRKRLEKEYPEMTQPQIRVVELRRIEHKQAYQPEHRPVDWSCQWLVHGFWREQACGPKLKDHRHIWVSSFIKGPVDKPFRGGERLFLVDR